MTTAKIVFDAFADGVNRILEREWRKPTEGQMNDFVSLSVAGEMLRRLCNTHLEDEDEPQPYAFETLTKYDLFLSKYEGEYPYHAVDDLTDILADLKDYSNTHGPGRDYEYGCQLLIELEHTLMIIVAGWRARRALDEQVVIKCANKASEKIDEIADCLYDLCQFAEDHELVNGSDDNFMQLYAFWDNLADLAPSRKALARVVKESMRREKRIEDALARLASKDKKES